MKVRHVFMLMSIAGSVVAPGAIAKGIDDLLGSNDFRTYHPDMDNRNAGLEAYRRGKFEQSATYFRRAARYADKASEAMLAMMYWKGEGVATNRPLAYAWMDLAAERGYPSLLVMRENYWRQLGPAEQAQAIDAGQAVYAEFADSVAKPRLAAELRRGLSEATGSHTGFVGTLAIHVPTSSDKNLAASIGNAGLPGDQYYAPQLWNAMEYFAAQDAAWNAPRRTGHVNVGPLEQLRSDNAHGPGELPSDHVPQLE